MAYHSVRKRHQDPAFISDFQHLKSVFANGFLLAVYRGSEWVGAKLVHRQSNNTLRSANVAWRNGDEGLMKDRVGEALMFELINRGKAEGFEFLDLGNSLPFVDDGALSFKIRWGTDLVFPYIRFEGGKLQGATGFLAAAFNLTSQSAQAMLHHNPVLVCHKGAVKAVGWNSPIPTTFRRQVKRRVEWIDMAGTLP